MNIASSIRLERPTLPPASIAPAADDSPAQWQPSVYEPPRSCRVMGGGGAVAVFASALLLLFWTARVRDIPLVSAASDAIVVTLAPSQAAPPAPPVEVALGPTRHEQQPDDRKAKPSDNKTQQRQSAVQEVATPIAGPMPAALAGSPPSGTPAADTARVDRTTAPPSESRPATVAAAPVTSASSSTSALANWQGELLGHLKQFRRYPRQAESAGQEGVALVSITVDRAGKVLGVKLVQGSGYPLLDMEAQATVRRASPVPPPGADIPGDPVTAQIPIEFSISQ